MIYLTKILYEVDAGADKATEAVKGGDEAKTEILDADTKTNLDTLTLSVDIMSENSATQFSNIDSLFSSEGGINSLSEDKKNEALKYALKESKIKIGNEQITIAKIAELFGKYVKQDGSSWKLAVSDISDVNDKPFEDLLKSLVSNSSESPLAYLVQKSANFIKIQAAKGYGEESDNLLEIKEDKKLGNQTRRALAGLKSWIEGNQDMSEETLSGLTVENVLGMSYVSEELKNKIIANAQNDEVKTLWDSVGKEGSSYEWRVPYTNNYAIKKKVETDPAKVPDGVAVEAAKSEAAKNNIINNLGLKDGSSKGIVKRDYGIPDTAEVYIREGVPGCYYFEDGAVMFVPSLDNKQDVSSYKFTKLKGTYNSETCKVDWSQVEAFPETENAKRYILTALSEGLEDFKIPTKEKEIIHDGGTWYLKSFGHKTNLGSLLLGGWIVPGNSWDALKKNLKYANFANKIAELTEGKTDKDSEFKMKKNRDLVLSGAIGYWGDYDLVDDDTLLDKYPEMVQSEPQKTFVDYLNKYFVQSESQEDPVDFLNETFTLVT